MFKFSNNKKSFQQSIKKLPPPEKKIIYFGDVSTKRMSRSNNKEKDEKRLKDSLNKSSMSNFIQKILKTDNRTSLNTKRDNVVITSIHQRTIENIDEKAPLKLVDKDSAFHTTSYKRNQIKKIFNGSSYKNSTTTLNTINIDNIVTNKVDKIINKKVSMDESKLNNNLKITSINFKKYFNLDSNNGKKETNFAQTLRNVDKNINISQKEHTVSPKHHRNRSELKTLKLTTVVTRIKEKINDKDKIRRINFQRPLSCNKIEEIIPNNNIANFINEASTSTDSSLFRGRIEDYIIGKEIGKGAYAVVKKAVHKPTNLKLAIKIYNKINLVDQHRKNSVKREIETLKRTEHTNIVKLHEIIENPKTIMLIMELVEGMSLLNYLKSRPNKRIDEYECKDLLGQIMRGVQYCHTNSIYHRDIKLENLIIDNNRKVKIIDFGFATYSPNTKLLNFFCGTPSYMPPEIVQKKDYQGCYVDIWSCGILMYTFLCGNFPFKALSEKELFTKISKGIFNIPTYLSNEAKNLLKKILVINPDKRPSAADILKDVWFTS